MKHYNIAVIGAGAGGLFFTANMLRNKPDTTIALIEKNQRIGRKLAVTGNGRCNLTNIHTNPSNYHGSFAEFTPHLLSECSAEKVIEIFSDFGLVTRTDEQGRVYPKSNQASTMLDTLRFNCENDNVDTLLETTVESIYKKNSKFIIKSDKQNISADTVIIATGGAASPKNGGDKSGYEILRGLGHTIIKPSPALCPINVKSDIIKSLKGLRAQGKVSLICDNKITASEEGEIQFTDAALSGICVFNLSQYIEKGKHYTLSLNLLPELDIDRILSLLTKNRNLFKKLEAENLMTGIFQKRIAQAILKISGIPFNKSISQITNKELEAIAARISSFDFEVTGVGDFSQAQVTKGGVKGSEINSKTMESKNIKGLYIIGEAIDCIGDCGGFNLQFAFATAYLASEAL